MIEITTHNQLVLLHETPHTFPVYVQPNQIIKVDGTHYWYYGMAGTYACLKRATLLERFKVWSQSCLKNFLPKSWWLKRGAKTG